MTDDYLTPGGKFDITLVGKTRVVMEGAVKKVEKYFVTNDDGETAGAKSPRGMFPINILNDLGLVVEKIHAYYHGGDEVIETPAVTTDTVTNIANVVTTPTAVTVPPAPVEIIEENAGPLS